MGHRVGHDLVHHLVVELLLKHRVEQARKVAVHALVARDQLVGEGEAGMSPRFLSQKMAQKEPEKKMPSTTANATSRSAKRVDSLIHRSAQAACRRRGEESREEW